MADGEVKLRVMVDGARSIADMEKELKAVLAQFKGLPIASKEFQAVGAQIKNLRNELGEARKAAESSASAMMRSYFQTGEAIRSKALPSVMEFNRIIQDAPFGLQGIANNVTRLAETFSTLSRDAGGAGAGIKAMISSVVAGPMGIVVAISAVTTLIQLFGKDLVAALRSVKEEAFITVSQIRELEGLIGTRGSLYEFRTKQIGGFSDQRLQSELNVRTGFLSDIDLSLRKKYAELDAEKDEQKQKNLQKEIDLLLKRQAIEEKFLDAIIREREERDKIDAKNTQGNRAFDLAVARGEAAGARGLTAFRGQGAIAPVISGQVPTGMGLAPGQTFEGNITKGAEAFQALQSSVSAGVNAMSAQVGNQLGNAFASVFGGAGTLLGSFVQAFTQALTELATRAAALWFFDQIPGVGTVVRAASAAGAPSGSGSVVGDSNFGLQSISMGNAMRSNQPMQLRTEIKGTDLAIIVSKGDRLLATRMA
jgi:hypothetical protein